MINANEMAFMVLEKRLDKRGKTRYPESLQITFEPTYGDVEGTTLDFELYFVFSTKNLKDSEKLLRDLTEQIVYK